MAPRSDGKLPGLIALQRSDAAGSARWVHFHSPEIVLEAWNLSEVPDLIRAAESAQTVGKHAVGWIYFEAAPAFAPSLPSRPPVPNLPLAKRSKRFSCQQHGCLYR